MVPNIFSWGPERSTYHKTMVQWVHAYLNRKYGVADSERSLVDDRITDTFAYDKKSKTLYLCEIKVNWNDLQKAPYQIHDTVFRFKRAHKGAKVVPVVAFPLRLQKELIKEDTWGSFRDTCKKIGVAIWIIEQSSIRQAQGPTTSSTKAQPAPKSTTKARGTKAKSAAAKPTKVKVTKKTTAKAKPTKRKTTTGKRTKSTVAKPKRIKTTKAKVTKRKTATGKSTKSRVARTTTTKAKTTKVKATKKK